MELAKVRMLWHVKYLEENQHKQKGSNLGSVPLQNRHTIRREIDYILYDWIILPMTSWIKIEIIKLI